MSTNTLSMSRIFPADPSAVFEAFTTPDLLARWMAPTDEHKTVVHELDPQPGGAYRLSMMHHSGAVHTVRGRFLTVEPPTLLEYTWEWEGMDAAAPIAGETVVRVEFEEVEDGTCVLLTHSLQNEESVVAHADGWEGCLWRLANTFTPSPVAWAASTLALHRLMAENALDGVPESDLDKPLGGPTNTLRWLIGHVVSTRAYLASLLGQDVDAPATAMYAAAVDPDAAHPTLETILGELRTAGHAVLIGLRSADDAWLRSDSPQPVPMTGQTMADMLAFLISHDAYHIGQMGIVRKGLGYDALSYAPHWPTEEAPVNA